MGSTLEAISGWGGLLTLLCIVPCVVYFIFRLQRRSISIGSGDNNRWNRLIRTDMPVFPLRKQFKLEHAWKFVEGEGGRQTWSILNDTDGVQDAMSFDPRTNPNSSDKILRAQLLARFGDSACTSSIPSSLPITPVDALTKGWNYWSRLQCSDGHWPGDYGGPMFLLPGLVVACYAIGGDVLGPARRSAMATYLLNHQQIDGGWGLHIEGPATVFGTTMCYVALRLLGTPPEDPACVAGRRFILRQGGAVMNPHWGKFWLATLGVMDWDAVNPVPPELWMLPRWFPYHPGKMWCHCRMVYLPMSYIYGTRGTATIGPLQLALRDELYVTPYDTIIWDSVRNQRYEWYAPRGSFNWIRNAGATFALEYIQAEDSQTNYIDIGPVNKAVNMLAALYAHGPKSDQLRSHIARIDDYLHVAEDGMKMQGYNGSQLWDTSFALQALTKAPASIIEKFGSTMKKAHSFVDISQIREDVPNRERYFRAVSKGGWPFSTQAHGWPIADCTSEAMLAAFGVRDLALGASALPAAKSIDLLSLARFEDSIELLSRFQNADGGWATYEEKRGGNWYEYLNPAEVFGDIMIDYTYTELTSSSIKALAAFRRHHPSHRSEHVARMIAHGVQFVRDQQREDGSWYGSWAVCFTYGCWFGAEALAAGGDPTGLDSGALARCCAFLLSQQLPDGGWGETYLSCLTKTYKSPDPPASQIINTAWAVLALVAAQCADGQAVKRGVQFIISKQLLDGNWEQERISGIFNRTCGITYSSYRNIFPLWALAAYETGYKLKT